MVKENIALVKERISNACQRAGRDTGEVTLIAVSKTKPVDMIYEALETGTIDYGENKVQEMCDKIETINNADIHWHLIGHLQTNKVKYIVDKAYLIHSVDSLKLAKVINEQAEKKGVTANILVEVNVAKEESKFGVMPEECEDLVREIANMSNISVKGLMTIAPFVDNPEENRVHFRNLRKLLVDINNKNIDNISMNVLSMGMTNDYEVAIEEGATLVRVGTGIFGERDYNKIGE